MNTLPDYKSAKFCRILVPSKRIRLRTRVTQAQAMAFCVLGEFWLMARVLYSRFISRLTGISVFY